MYTDMRVAAAHDFSSQTFKFMVSDPASKCSIVSVLDIG